MNDSERAALAILESTPAVLRATLATLPGDLLTTPVERDWAPRHVAVHLLDVDHDGFRARFDHMLAEERPAITSIDDVLERMEADTYSRPLTELLDDFERGRRDSCDWLAALTDDQLTRAADHDQAGEITVSNLLHYWAYHDLAHLRQVQRMLRSVVQHHLGNAAEYDV